MLNMTLQLLPPGIDHFSTIYRIIVDHRSWEHFETFCEMFTRDDFNTTLRLHQLDSEEVTFLYYLYIDPNDLFREGRHSYERYLRVYKSKKGLLIVRIGTCELFNDQQKELWQEIEKHEVQTLGEVCDLLMKRFEADLTDMTSFFH